MELGKIGIWWSGWQKDDGFFEAAADMEEAGYGALWMSGGFASGLASRFRKLLAATSSLTVASGIIGVWQTPAADLAKAVDELEGKERFLLGLGVSHAPVVESVGQGYERPYSKMVEFLDDLDAAEPTVPTDRRMLAALGPKMLRLAAERSVGAHPYFTPPEHTADARAIIGPAAVLAPEVAVVVQQDQARARELARRYMSGYLQLPNYSGNLRRLGYGDDDLGDPEHPSDRLVDAIVPCGDPRQVAAGVRRHFEAGADHVCIQVVSETGRFPSDDYRTLARELVDG